MDSIWHGVTTLVTFRLWNRLGILGLTPCAQEFALFLVSADRAEPFLGGQTWRSSHVLIASGPPCSLIDLRRHLGTTGEVHLNLYRRPGTQPLAFLKATRSKILTSELMRKNSCQVVQLHPLATIHRQVHLKYPMIWIHDSNISISLDFSSTLIWRTRHTAASQPDAERRLSAQKVKQPTSAQLLTSSRRPDCQHTLWTMLRKSGVDSVPEL